MAPEDDKAHLRSGVFWLGSANVAAQVLDAISLVAILAFLTQQELGVATLAWSVAVVLEAFNGLGIGGALLQAPSLTREQTHSAFWYSCGVGLLFFALLCALAPWVAGFYGRADLVSMLIVSAAKLPVVSAALIPLQLLNRALRFRDIAAIQTAATLLSSVVKIVLAALGAGAWALVWANTMFGVFTLVGAFIAQPLRPQLRFVFGEIRELVRYGRKIFYQSVVYHTYRNADFLVIGRVLGDEALGVYRVAFDLAMTPAQMVQLTVTRTAFPVFARMLDDRRRLAETFAWTLRAIAFMVAPIALFLTFAGADLLLLLGQERWSSAGGPLTILAWAAVLRATAQVFPELFKAAGEPGRALYATFITGVLLVGGFIGGLQLFPNVGTLPVAWVWLLAQPVMLVVLFVWSTRLIPLAWRTALAALGHPMAASALAALPLLALLALRDQLGGGRL